MQTFTEINDPKIAELLQGGAIGILRTDTLYGIVGRADSEASVSRIYALKERSEHKSPIVLISAISQLFDKPSGKLQALLTAVWPAKVSVIIPSRLAPLWIRRGNNSAAYRMPDDASLRQLIEQVGPLVAPSANFEGDMPAMTIEQANKYFGDKVDFYVDGGEVTDSTPSQLISLNESGAMERLR